MPLIYSILTFLTPFLLFLTSVLPHSYFSLTHILTQVFHVCTFPFLAQVLARILASNPDSFIQHLAHISPHILSANPIKSKLMFMHSRSFLLRFYPLLLKSYPFLLKSYLFLLKSYPNFTLST